MEEIRLQKYLANNGIGSRRACEQYILEGKIRGQWKNSYRVRHKNRTQQRFSHI